MGTPRRKVVGYVRVSTQEQGDSGAGIEAQVSAIQREAEHHRWDLVAVLQDVASGSSRDRRPQLQEAMRMVREGEADTLAVSKLDRLSRSAVDFGAIIEESRKEGWTIVIIDLGVDLGTPAGEMVASIMAVLAQWERRMISQRTIDALRERKRSGMKLGRPVGTTADTETLIVGMKDRGASLRGIAQSLTTMCIPTPQGGSAWRASSVAAVLKRLERADASA